MRHDETFVNLMNSDSTEFDRLVNVSVGDSERYGTLAQDSNIVTLINHIKPGKFPDLDAVAEEQLTGLALTQMRLPMDSLMETLISVHLRVMRFQRR